MVSRFCVISGVIQTISYSCRDASGGGVSRLSDTCISQTDGLIAPVCRATCASWKDKDDL